MSPLLSRQVRREIAKRNAGEDIPGGELNVVPFLDIVTNLLLFLLATVSSAAIVGQVDAHLAALGPRRPGPAPETVSVTLTDRGIVIAAPGGFVPPGCGPARRTSSIAIAPRDWDSLSSCMLSVRERVADDRVIVSADPTIPYEDLLHAIDAVRARGERPLFAEVLVSAGVR